MPQTDTLQIITKTVSTVAEPVQATSANWVVAFVQAYVWQDPRAIYYLLIAYAISLALKLHIVYNEGQLTAKKGGKDLFNSITNISGLLVLLYLSSNLGHFVKLLDWFPDTVYGAIMLALFLQVAKHLSKLGYITPELYNFIEGRLKNFFKNNEKDDTQDPQDPMDSPKE
jgi:hypothetical protein